MEECFWVGFDMGDAVARPADVDVIAMVCVGAAAEQQGRYEERQNLVLHEYSPGRDSDGKAYKNKAPGAISGGGQRVRSGNCESCLGFTYDPCDLVGRDRSAAPGPWK